MLNFRAVPLPKRLYAFAVDITAVVMMKITLIQALNGHLNSILKNIGSFSSQHHLESQLTFFVFSVFPLIWMAYCTVSHFISGSTIGSKIFGFHFENIEGSQRLPLSFKQSFHRSLILLTCIYTWGFVAALMLVRKNSSVVITDLVENVVAVNNHDQFVIENQEIKLLPLMSAETRREMDQEKDAA